jgi:hypothetical protein
MDFFLVGYVNERVPGKSIVRGLGKLLIKSKRLVLCCLHEPDCSNQLVVREFAILGQTGKRV